MIPARQATIREARNDDAERIAAVFAAGCVSAYSHFFPAEVLSRYTADVQVPRWTGHLAALPPEHRVFTASVDGRVIGFIEVGPADASSGRGPRTGEVHYLFVHPDHVRHGTGGDLLTFGEDRLAEAGHADAILWVFRDNASARHFYARMGWAPTGTERFDPSLAALGHSIADCQYSRPLDRPDPRPAPPTH